MGMGLYLSDVPRQVRLEYDKLLELREKGAGAIAATGSTTPIKFDSTLSDFKVVLSHDVVTGYVAGTTQWSFNFEIGATSGGAFVVVQGISLGGAAAEREIAVSAAHCQSLVPNAKYARITATKAGTPGDLTYGAVIACQ